MCHWSIHAKPGYSLRFDSLLKAENVAAMRAGAAGHLTRRCVSSNSIAFRNRLPDPRPFFALPVFNPKFMAQKADSEPIRSELKADGKEEKDSEKLPREVPPPPEKPLPGDCCGSGCVRCVWDVYYEELEEYNKLYKQNQTPKS